MLNALKILLLVIATCILLSITGCTDPDPYYRIEKVEQCVQPPAEKTACANPACSSDCKVVSGHLLELPPEGICQIGGALGVTVCVQDCSQCDE